MNCAWEKNREDTPTGWVQKCREQTQNLAKQYKVKQESYEIAI